jgi:8-oxo-dGTP pyrophosphatase MutT (NUDIX family)
MLSSVQPRVVSRHQTRISPWVELVSKGVLWTPEAREEVYHCLALPDYVSVLATTRSGLIAVVRQYRPAVEAYTLELPAGLVERDEMPEAACRRELKEEAGLEIDALVPLGVFYPDTGRLTNRMHVFFARASDPDPAFVPEARLAVEFMDMAGIRECVLDGRFQHQLHLGIFAVAAMRGLIDLVEVA